MNAPDPAKLTALLQQLAAVKQAHHRLLGLVSELVGTEAADPLACRLTREADYWTVAHAGTVTRLRDCKGLGYLAMLVTRPHVEVAAVELTQTTPESQAPVLDRSAKAAYRERLAELRDRTDETAQLESQAITRELARAVGLHGRDRPTGAAERARINATRTIKDAIGRIARGDRELGHHLAVSVRTGAYCCYDPNIPRTWVT
ncbi:MAG: hypothetical protein ABI867_21290 [Kofleriaceae bacterium]